MDANASKTHLYERAKQLDIPGRSGMSKDELVAALQQRSRRDTAARRSARR